MKKTMGIVLFFITISASGQANNAYGNWSVYVDSFSNYSLTCDANEISSNSTPIRFTYTIDGPNPLYIDWGEYITVGNSIFVTYIIQGNRPVTRILDVENFYMLIVPYNLRDVFLNAFREGSTITLILLGEDATKWMATFETKGFQEVLASISE